MSAEVEECPSDRKEGKMQRDPVIINLKYLLA